MKKNFLLIVGVVILASVAWIDFSAAQEVSDDYILCDSIDNLQEAFNAVLAPFNSTTTILVSDGTFSGDVEFIGKTAGGAYNLTVQGSTSSTTTISGETSIRQKIFLSDLTFIGRVFEYSGADVDWTTCVTSGDDGFIITKSTFITNVFRTTSVIVFENDPGTYTNIASTVTIGYSFYVATAALGGSDANNDGLLITQGSATSTTANKLVDSTASFTTAKHNGMTIWNPDDDTWAEVTAVDSGTTLSLDTDVMVSGESYKLVAARSTIQGTVEQIPGVVNSNTMIKISGDTYYEMVTLSGKALSGDYSITIKGTVSTDDSATDATTYTVNTIGDTGLAMTTDEHVFKTTRITGGTGEGQRRIIKSNTATVLTIYGDFAITPDATSDFVVEDWITKISGATSGAPTTSVRTNCILVDGGQSGIVIDSIEGEYTLDVDGTIGAIFGAVNGSVMTLKSVYGHDGDVLVRGTKTATVLGQGIFIERPTSGNGVVVIGDGSNMDIDAPVARLGGTSTQNGIQSTRASSILIRWGGFIDGFTARNGFGVDRTAAGQLVGNTTANMTISNCGWGLRAQRVGQIFVNTANITFTGNTVDIDAVAAKFGFIGI